MKWVLTLDKDKPFIDIEPGTRMHEQPQRSEELPAGDALLLDVRREQV